MKFKEYLDQLNQLGADNPQVLELTVVYSKDEEGNGFNELHYTPTVGHFDGEYNGEFTDELEEDQEVNAICVN